ncbi:MAG: ATP-dependent helicase HrpB [Bdellovibrionaceae bacterium]|nr:ATP-dependent helicase HrpB [Pseudobdellovibrionaceae bacterium]
MQPLPIDAYLDDIVKSVTDYDQVVLTATPGAGKTTRLPSHLLNAVEGKIAILQPRRMAAVSACQFVAEENNWSVGKEVGYQVRFESQAQSNTRLLFMTDAVLLRRLVDDPELNEFDLIVIDEFHERNIHQDIVLGVLKELQEMGRTIKILVMSATLDTKPLKHFFSDMHFIDVPGRVFPLDIRYSQSSISLNTDFSFIDRMCDAVLHAVAETAGDILVFLPGVGEIQRVQDRLLEKKVKRDILPLHGSLSLQEQRQVLQKSENQRIILATNIAEASVTVPGVNFVIDSGLMRMMTTNLNSGFSRLGLTPISQFNAKQRAGRAARQQAGVCLRLWTKFEESSREEKMTPECQRTDLTGALLILSHLGIRDFASFAWLETPPAILLKRSMDFLRTTEAIDDENNLTPKGKKLLKYPVEPRWGTLLYTAEEIGGTSMAAHAVSLLQDRDIFLNRKELYHAHTECDLTYRLQVLGDILAGRDVRGVSRRQCETIEKSSAQISKILTEPKIYETKDLLSRLLLLSQADRLCRRRGQSERALMVGGRGVRLSPDSQVRESEFFIALQGVDLPQQPDTNITMASGITKNLVLQILAPEIKWIEETFFDEDKGLFYQKRLRKFRDLELDEPVLTPISSEDLGDDFVDMLVARWPTVLAQNEDLKRWMERWHFFISDDPEQSVFFTEVHKHQLLEMAAFGKNKIEEVTKQNLVSLLESIIDRTVRSQFRSRVPEKFAAPSGGQHRIHYESSEGPYVEVRLQELFGLTKTPSLGVQKRPLIFRLLAPNFRPVQVTSDIEGFWARAYIEVRKELRGRYPKHPWPEDPLTAIPVAKGRRR